MIDWDKLTKEDALVIDSIVQRAARIYDNIDIIGLTMDISACHTSGSTLRLYDLYNANEFNFQHDIHGIQANMDRFKGTLKNNFTPKYSLR